MVLGALVDLGLDVNELTNVLNEIGLENFSLEAERVKRNGIGAVNLHVKTGHEHKHRHLKHILEIIDSPVFSDSVKQKIEKIFRKIAEAEAKVHGTTIEKVHFHEVGAMDSIIDITGSVWGLERLGIEKLFCSQLTLGSGTVKCEHGIMPVPAPATLEIVSGLPVIKKNLGSELTTPTGAAIAASLCDFSEKLPPFTIKKTGYGCGDRVFENMPNLFRIITGEIGGKYLEDIVSIVETNIDDMNPELLPHVSGKLFEAGALDVYITQMIMKKGRPGNEITVLCKPGDLNKITDLLFKETTTAGIRISECFRKTLKREFAEINTDWGKIKVKIFEKDGVKKAVPEFEECKRIAVKEGIAIQEVYNSLTNIRFTDDNIA